jgi:glucose-fructose oxidoreductase
MAAARRKRKRIRYGVVGLGYIAQIAVLPAFAHARGCELAALISDDETKLADLGDKYKVEHRFRDYDEALASGTFDALYIALPNNMHCEYTVRAAEAGIHVLCEKPMAVTADECEKMIHATEAADVRLMIAYRLHFEEANLRAVEIANSGQLGELRAFHSAFAINVQPGNIRLEEELGGGTLYDIGIYCINAARYIFRDEPIEVTAFSAARDQKRFEETDELSGAVLRFPHDRLALFLSSFGAAEVGWYQIVGTKGNLRVDPAYDYVTKLTHYLTIDGQTKKKAFAKRDQFAPQLTYFARCIRDHREPEPNGREGLIDVQIIEALYESARTRRPMELDLGAKRRRPSLDQEEQAPPVRREPELVHASSPQPN